MLAFLIEKGVRIYPNEMKVTTTAFLIVFMLMASYFVLRPVRDAMASDWTDAEVSVLWNLQFFLSVGIVSGASGGAIVGPLLPTLFASKLGLNSLMLLAAGGLLMVVPLVLYVYHLKTKDLKNTDVHANLSMARQNASWWSGYRSTVTNPVLLAICAFILLYVFIGSFVYFEQKNLLADFSRNDRARILGSIDGVVNILTFVLAFFVTGRMVEKLGMATALVAVPVTLMLGMLVLAVAPAIVVVLAIQVARRAGNYAVTRPAREMLFTEVTTDERYKAKPVIDVVVYRGGDAMSGSVFALLSDGVGLGLAAISLVGAGIAAVWGALAIYLGKRYERRNTATGLSFQEIARDVRNGEGVV